jgi:hypothetical protein
MPRLTVIAGGSTPCGHPAHQCQELRVELAVSLAERLVHVRNGLIRVRAAQRALAAGADGAAGTWVLELEKELLREGGRAQAALAFAEAEGKGELDRPVEAVAA